MQQMMIQISQQTIFCFAKIQIFRKLKEKKGT
jgi:hypothetical protein